MAQRVVAFHSAPGADQQPEPVIETIPDIASRHRRHTRGCQLDSQRNSVKTTADLCDRRRLVRVGQREAWCHIARPLDEQRHRRRVDSCPDLQRGHRPQLLVGDPQSFAAGGQNPHGRRLREGDLNEISCGVQHVLAVVEHQQPHPALQRGGHTVIRLFPGCWVMPNTAATASGTAAGSVTAASSNNQTPSGNSSASRAATSVARRVLPTPPTPVNVTNR